MACKPNYQEDQRAQFGAAIKKLRVDIYVAIAKYE